MKSEEEKQIDLQLFLNWISKTYEENKNNILAYCKNKKLEYDEDVYQSSILLMHDIIKKNGLKDTSDQGMKSYFFMVLRNNMLREKLYARNQKNDANTDNIDALYDVYYNSVNLAPIKKIQLDTLMDFSVIYVLKEVEKHFDQETFNYVRLKFFLGITYKQLIEMTGDSKARTKVSECLKWLKENITKEQIRKEFEQEYGDLLDD